MALTVGDRLGVYEILSAIGAGGMGEVYRARDTTLARDVAIKVLPAEFALDPERLARFKREAQVLASLNHQNIAGIYGFEASPAEAGHYIHALVLEFVDGPTLADRIAQGPLPLDEALPIVRQIAEALEAAHEQGIIHRDLKPANIKVRPDGTVKVLDFGLAKLIEGPEGPPQGGHYVRDGRSVRLQPDLTMSPTITTPAMTMAGVILGTAAYMSPEQAKGRAADKRSDIWAFGCVLWEMLTGKRVFEGEDVSDTLASVLRADVEFARLPRETPAALSALLRRCLDRDVKGRLRDIGEARIAIERAIAHPHLASKADATGPATAGHYMRVWRVVPLLVCAALAAALTAFVVIALRPPIAPPVVVTRFAIPLPEGQRFSGLPRHVLDVSRDGTQFVYAANRRLYRRAFGELDAIPIAGSENPTAVASPTFSPDGRWIAFIGVVPGGTAIQKIPSSGGTPQTVMSAPATPYGLSWSADGILVGGGSRGVLRVSPDAGMPDVLVTVKAGQLAVFPRMLPGGDAVLYTRRGSDFVDADTGEIVVHSLKSNQDKTVIKSGHDARYLESGHLVYAVAGMLFAVPFDLKKLEVTGEPVQVVNGVQRLGALGVGGGADFSVSSTGALAYVPGPPLLAQAQLDLALIDRNGQVERLKLPAVPYEAPRVSPDGKQIAVSSRDAKEAVVWIYDLSGTTSPRRLTFGGLNRFPVWSGDSQRVAFQSDREGDQAIFVQRADGNGPAERLTTPAQGISHLPDSWSPDGEHLLFTEFKGTTEISSWILSTRDKKVSPFGDIRSLLPINAVFSPNGKWVAYQSGRPGDNGVYVQPFPSTGSVNQISKGSAAHHPAWSRDGREIIYIPAQSNAVVVSINTQPGFSVSKATVELPLKGLEGGPASIRSYDVMPDGRLLAIVNADTQQSIVPENPQIRVVLNWFEELKSRVPVK